MKEIALAVVIREGLVLIQHRIRRSGWVYEFPGGAVDPGETGEQAALRELREETGLTAGRAIHQVRSRNDLGGILHFIVVALLEPQEPWMTDAARQQTFYWMRPDEIPTGTFPAADALFIREQLPGIVSGHSPA